MVKKQKEIPKFIQVRGCINCEASKKFKEKTGKDYGFDHELVAGCMILGCCDYGYSLTSPFLDPEEVMKKANETQNSSYIENAKKYCAKIKEKFRDFYRRIGINLESIVG